MPSNATPVDRDYDGGAVALQEAALSGRRVVLGVGGDQLDHRRVGGGELGDRLLQRFRVGDDVDRHRPGGHVGEVERQAVDDVGERVARRRHGQPVDRRRRVGGGLALRHRRHAARRVEGEGGDARGAKAIGRARVVRADQQARAAGVGHDQRGDACAGRVDLVANVGQRVARRDRHVDRAGAGLRREARLPRTPGAELDPQRSGARRGRERRRRAGGDRLHAGERGDLDRVGARCRVVARRAHGRARRVGDRLGPGRAAGQLGGEIAQGRDGALDLAVLGNGALDRRFLRLQHRQRFLLDRHQLGDDRIDVQAAADPCRTDRRHGATLFKAPRSGGPMRSISAGAART